VAQIDITYILNARWPTIRAYGLQVAKVCQGLKQAGAKVRLLIPMRARHVELRGRSPSQVYGIRDEFRIIRLPSLDFAWLRRNGKILFLIQQTFFAFASALYLLIRPSEIVYSRDPFVLFFLSFVRRGLYWEVHRVPEDMNRLVYRRIMRSVNGYIVISEGIRDRLLSFGISDDRILVAPDGIDMEEKCEYTDGMVTLKEKRLVVYTGQLLEWKGVGTLIDAAQRLNSSFAIVVVGGQPGEIAQLQKRDIAGRVVFTGFVSHAQALGWMRSAQVLVIPNQKDGGISEFFTSPLKMFEYMASGRPIVASDLPSLREVLTDANAILVTPDDASALAQGIERACTDDGQKRARQALVDVAQYTWEQRAQKVIHFIRS
jgi:glycosyltransferase involved in cell wall biosynthesis